MTPISIGFSIYLLLILFVGIYTARQMTNMKDFALGGNKLGPVVIAFSERASGESAWLILGLPGAAILGGFLESWTVIGCVSGIIFSWFMIATKLRNATGHYNAITLPELFSKIFGNSKSIQIIASTIITFFFTFYVAAQFAGAGKVLNVTFGIPETQGMLLGAVLIVFYTLMGGFLAVAWTDLVQGIIMIATLVILPLVAWIELGDSLVFENFFSSATFIGETQGWAAITLVIGGLSWGLGYMGQPHLVSRYMAIDKVENIKLGRRIAISWAVPAFIGSMLIGVFGKELILSGKVMIDGVLVNGINDLKMLISNGFLDPEKLMPAMATALLNPWVAGILISGAIAAMMSTADSQLLVSTTVLTEDIVGRFWRNSVQNFNLLTIGRMLTVIIGVVAFFLAYESKEMVFEMVSYAWGGLGASFGPALLLTLWWKKTSKIGVISGMITGTLFTVIDLFGAWVTVRFSAFVLALIAVILGSLIGDENRVENSDTIKNQNNA